MVARRFLPDPVQFQVVVGSLLGDGRLVGVAGERRLRLAHGLERSDYVRWKYDRLAGLAVEPPRRAGALLVFETVRHPLFDDLAPLFSDGARCGSEKRIRRREVLELLRPLGLAVWMADLGRLDLRHEAFLPRQREAMLVADPAWLRDPGYAAAAGTSVRRRLSRARA